MGQQRTDNGFLLSGLKIRDLNGDTTIELPSLYTQSKSPVSKKDTMTSEDLQKRPHLRYIFIDTINSDVGLLIGVNVRKAMDPWDVIANVHKGPFAIKSLFGWIINGPLDTRWERSTYETYVTANHIEASLEEQVRCQLNHDFCERVINYVPDPSKED